MSLPRAGDLVLPLKSNKTFTVTRVDDEFVYYYNFVSAEMNKISMCFLRRSSGLTAVGGITTWIEVHSAKGKA